jgi:SAM-dependent methyltransferase
VTRYGVDRDIYDASIYDAMNTFTGDVPFYLRQARRARGPVLELCCGTGRVLLALARAGIDVTGVDFTASMLARARAKARTAGLSVPLIRGDMRRVRLGRRFALVYIPFNSLQNTYTIADLERVFAAVRAHLRPAGRFVFDVFNPDVHLMVRNERLQKRKYRFRLEDGRPVAIDEQLRYDSAGQVVRVTWTHHLGRERPRPQRLDMRCLYPLELDALLKYNGFRLVRKYGDFRSAPFRAGSMKQVCVCEIA